MKTREEKRGEYSRIRKRKFDFLRNSGQLDNFYKQKFKKEVSPIKMNWFKRFVNLILKIFKK